jgi:ligand-binding SRPBCC domain-containing protein
MTRTHLFSQLVNAPMPALRRFFHDVNNLPRLAPPFPSVSLVDAAGPVEAGATFRLRVAAGPLSMTWFARIEEVRSDGSFTDSFGGGPFRSWRHTHEFEAAGDQTIARDIVEIEPSWWFTPFAPLFVRSLFLYRRRALRRIFP